MTEITGFNYRLVGPESAPVITFIPGIGNDISFWQVQADALSDQYRVLTFDPWGHGDSPEPPDGCGFGDVLIGIVRLWDTVGIERSTVVGLGFGGSVALALSLEYPARVDHVVACCCRPRQPDDRRDFWRDRLAKAREGGLDELCDITVDRWLAPDFRAIHPEVDKRLRLMIKRTSVEGYCAYVNAFIEMDFDARLESIEHPVLLVAAEHDHGGGPVGDMETMAKRIPSSTFHVLAGSGHICNHEQPEAVTQIIRDFLKKGVSGIELSA